MNASDVWNAVVSAEEAYMAAPQGAMASAAGGPGPAGAALTAIERTAASGFSQWTTLSGNVAALAVGLGFFVLGALMLAFSFGEQLADVAEKALARIPTVPAE